MLLNVECKFENIKTLQIHLTYQFNNRKTLYLKQLRVIIFFVFRSPLYVYVCMYVFSNANLLWCCNSDNSQINFEYLHIVPQLYYLILYNMYAIQVWPEFSRVVLELLRFILKRPRRNARCVTTGERWNVNSARLPSNSPGLDPVMSNNSAATSSLAIAQKTVKQLRLEASVRRIKVRATFVERWPTDSDSCAPWARRAPSHGLALPGIILTVYLSLPSFFFL